MSKSGISYPQWLARYGASPSIIFRNDPPEGQSVSDEEHFTHIGTWRLTTPSPEEIRRAGYSDPEPAFCYARLSLVWGCDRHGDQLIAALIFAIKIDNVPALNRMSNADLTVIWRGLVANGAEPAIVGRHLANRPSWFR